MAHLQRVGVGDDSHAAHRRQQCVARAEHAARPHTAGLEPRRTVALQDPRDAEQVLLHQVGTGALRRGRLKHRCDGDLLHRLAQRVAVQRGGALDGNRWARLRLAWRCASLPRTNASTPAPRAATRSIDSPMIARVPSAWSCGAGPRSRRRAGRDRSPHGRRQVRHRVGEFVTVGQLGVGERAQIRPTGLLGVRAAQGNRYRAVEGEIIGRPVPRQRAALMNEKDGLRPLVGDPPFDFFVHVR